MGREVLGEKGVLGKGSTQLANGAAMLILGIIVLLLEIFIFNMVIDSELVTVNGKMFLRIDEDVVTFLFILAALTAPFFLILGVSGIYYGVRSNTIRYTLGERRSVWVMRGTPGMSPDYYAVIHSESYCTKCNATLGQNRTRYCPECGNDLDPPEEKNY